jgi:ABC-type multidrug transport system fused ATPase/permease subunit
MRACDRVIRIERGLVVGDGPPENMLAKTTASHQADIYQRMA